MRGVSGVEMNGVLSRHAVGVTTHRLTGVGIEIEAREIATGAIQANAMPATNRLLVGGSAICIEYTWPGVISVSYSQLSR
jgi:hypothetical protein